MQLRRPLKVFLVELALGWAGEVHGLQLHGDWKLPKMRFKGSPTPQKLSLARQQQVRWICCRGRMPMCLQGLWLHPAANQSATESSRSCQNMRCLLSCLQHAQKVSTVQIPSATM